MSDYIATSIGRSGFATLAVFDPEGDFAYTVGFTDCGHPEILISGLKGDICHRLFWDMYREIKAGKRYDTGAVDTDLASLPTVFRPLRDDAAKEFCCQALFWYEDKPVQPTFLQLVMPDPAGLFPWQAGYDRHAMRAQRHLWGELH
jgi:hypothetical protein